MKYKVINIESWRSNDPEAPVALNDEIITLEEEIGRKAMLFGAVEPIEDDFLEEVEEVNPLKCEICGKICKSPAGLKVHQRSHK